MPSSLLHLPINRQIQSQYGVLTDRKDLLLLNIKMVGLSLVIHDVMANICNAMGYYTQNRQRKPASARVNMGCQQQIKAAKQSQSWIRFSLTSINSGFKHSAHCIFWVCSRVFFSPDAHIWGFRKFSPPDKMPAEYSEWNYKFRDSDHVISIA